MMAKAKEPTLDAPRAARVRAALHEAEAKEAIQRGVEQGPKRRMRTVSVTRQSPYGSGPETVEIGIDTDPLEHMAHRRQISVAQKQAGDRFKSAFEAVSGSRGLGVDLTREKVDTSGIGDSISQRAVDGMNDLQTAVAVLGKQDYAIVTAVAGQGIGVSDYAKRVGGAKSTDDARRYVGERFRDALTALAIEWRYEKPERARSRAHQWQDEESEEAYPEQKRGVAPWVHHANRPRK